MGASESSEATCCAGVGPTGGGFASPLDAKTYGEREKLLYIPAVVPAAADGEAKPDYIATVDLDPTSPTYSKVIHRLPMPHIGDELHHVGWNACSSCHGKPGVSTHNYLVVPGLLTGNIYFIDVKTDPKEPRFHKILEGKELAEKVGVAIPHTAHCAPTEIILSFLGGRDKDGNLTNEGNGFVALAPKTLEIIGRWEKGEKRPSYGYDFWYQPRKNVMVSSEWGDPAVFTKGFNPAHVAEGRYGHKLYFWDWTEHKIIQELDVGVGSIPLEVRFLHDPESTIGFVGNALSSEMVAFFQKEDKTWAHEAVIKIPNVKVSGWALPEMPALITDFVISLDDRFLYLSAWLHGEVQQWDISNPKAPKLAGKVHIGGSLQKGSGVERQDGVAQPEPLVVKGVKIQGGAQMVQLSLDGKRLFVSTSLFSPWDKQFYPELITKGAQLLQIDVDDVNGGLKLNPDFLVDFGAEPDGPALCHEMRFPGGDCTSDIWI